MGGLFHKRQNFLFCVSHLILSNMPKAIRPHAHCLNNAQFMSPPAPPLPPHSLSNNEWSGWLLSSTSAPLLSKSKRRQMRFKWEDAHAQENGPVSLFVCLSHAAISSAKLQKAFVCCVYLQDGRRTHRINRAAPAPIWTRRISGAISANPASHQQRSGSSRPLLAL